MDTSRKNRAMWNATSDAYQAQHGPQLDRKALAWGVWGLPEAELQVLGDVAGRDVLELGCGAAQWSLFLAQAGARPVGIDFSDSQLANARPRLAAAGVRLPLVQGSAEALPFPDARFDVVFCDHGATSFADPERAVPEAARVLRPGGLFAFNISSLIHDLCWKQPTDTIETSLQRDGFGLRWIEDAEQANPQRLHGDWIRLFRQSDLVVEDLLELRPPADATTTYPDFVPLDWARRWPAENIWKLRKPA